MFDYVCVINFLLLLLLLLIIIIIIIAATKIIRATSIDDNTIDRWRIHRRQTSGTID